MAGRWVAGRHVSGELGGVGVECGRCGSGPVYMETCEANGGPEGHIWVVASECQRCGHRYETSGCVDCLGAEP